MKNVLLISHDVIGRTMAGPGIRYYHMARVLARYTKTTLALFSRPDEDASPPLVVPDGADEEQFNVIIYRLGDWETLRGAVQRADVVICPSDTPTQFPQLAEAEAAIVIDGYDPLMAEWLSLFRKDPKAHENWSLRIHHLQDQYRVGDFFICASERQRDWWIGLLEAHGRLNPATFDADPSLRNLIAVVPYGLSHDAPTQTDRVLRGAWPGIEASDKLALWGGGLWPWLDPLTAVRALGHIWQQRQDIKLVFPGTKHPNPTLDKIPTHVAAAKELTANLGLTGCGIFFGDWIPYADWPNVLLESDVALTLHLDTLETRLAYRSRALEYIWAGLPIVATQGDAISELVSEHDLGVVVDYADVEGVAQAICQLADEPAAARAEGFVQARATLTWERAMQPLIGFCLNPHRAADRPVATGRVGLDPRVNAFTEAAHQQQIAELETERDRLRKLVIGYESGLFMRASRAARRLLGQTVGTTERTRLNAQPTTSGDSATL